MDKFTELKGTIEALDLLNEKDTMIMRDIKYFLDSYEKYSDPRKLQHAETALRYMCESKIREMFNMLEHIK